MITLPTSTSSCEMTDEQTRARLRTAIDLGPCYRFANLPSTR